MTTFTDTEMIILKKLLSGALGTYEERYDRYVHSAHTIYRMNSIDKTKWLTDHYLTTPEEQQSFLEKIK